MEIPVSLQPLLLVISIVPILALLPQLDCINASVSSRISLSPPERHEDSAASPGWTLSNYQGIWTDGRPCRAARAVYPATESDIRDSVAEAVREGLKMKVATSVGYSTTKISCPDGDEGLIISLRNYVPQPVFVNSTDMTATADAAMQLRDFVRELAGHGFTLPHTPLWDGVSVGGVIATGSHGSGFFMRGSSVSEYVVGARIVVPAPPEDGYARVLNVGYSSDPHDKALLEAVKMSLGVLGVLSKITFTVMPMFKRSLTIRLSHDDGLESTILRFSKAHDFASLFWVPSAGQVLYKEEDAVPIESEGEGANMFPLLLPMKVSDIKAMRAHQDSVERDGQVGGLCMSGEKMVKHRLVIGDGYRNSEDAGFTGFPVIGFNHHMQMVGGCQEAGSAIGINTDSSPGHDDINLDLTTCKWDPRLAPHNIFYHHTAVAIPMAKVPAFIRDVKRLRELNPDGMCSLNMFGGIHVRFLSAASAYLGEREDSAMFELIYYRARERSQPRLNEDLIEEMEQMMVMKYGGKPHWGKNRDIAFVGVEEKVVNIKGFLAVKAELDPDGLFSSAWTDELLGLHHSSTRGNHGPHCGLEGLCMCVEDIHCAPHAGYTCQAGQVYQAAHVCRRQVLVRSN